MVYAGLGVILLSAGYAVLLVGGDRVFVLANRGRNGRQICYPRWFPWRPVVDEADRLRVRPGPSGFALACLCGSALVGGTNALYAWLSPGQGGVGQALGLLGAAAVGSIIGGILGSVLGVEWVVDLQRGEPVLHVARGGNRQHSLPVSRSCALLVRYRGGSSESLGWQIALLRDAGRPTALWLMSGWCFFTPGFPVSEKGCMILAKRIGERCGIAVTEVRR